MNIDSSLSAKYSGGELRQFLPADGKGRFLYSGEIFPGCSPDPDRGAGEERDRPECTNMVTAEDKFKAIIPYQLKRAVKYDRRHIRTARRGEGGID